MLKNNFNDLPDFNLSAEEQRQRALRSVRHATRTKRATALITPASTSSPPPPLPPPFDPLHNPTEQQINRELRRRRQTEQEWRARLSRDAIQRDLEADTRKMYTPRQAASRQAVCTSVLMSIYPIPAPRVPCGYYFCRRWPIIRALQAKGGKLFPSL